VNSGLSISIGENTPTSWARTPASRRFFEILVYAFPRESLKGFTLGEHEHAT